LSGLGQGATSVSVRGQQACAIEIGPNGGVWCWGSNGSAAQINQTLVRDAIAVSVGDVSACELNSNMTAACWGDNSAGELGNGLTPTSSTVPILAALP
jgi:hypothetical protein